VYGTSKAYKGIGGYMKLKKIVLFVCLFFLNGMLFGRSANDEYSVSREIQVGTHDIVSLSARTHGDETIFEISFAEPIKTPDERVISQSGTTLKSYAPNGFYTFNLDLYVDIDRLDKSGRTSELVGGNSQFAPEFGWEKVICLNPQPNYARLMLEQEMKQLALEKIAAQKGRVTSEDKKEVEKTVKLEMQNEIYFPTLVRVHGKTVRFLVPNSFFGGTAAHNWNYSAAITNSKLLEVVTNSGKLSVTTASFQFNSPDQYALQDR
jgi:hypothetical protein